MPWNGVERKNDMELRHYKELGSTNCRNRPIIKQTKQGNNAGIEESQPFHFLCIPCSLFKVPLCDWQCSGVSGLFTGSIRPASRQIREEEPQRPLLFSTAE